MKKLNSSLMKDCLTRDEMRSVSGGLVKKNDYCDGIPACDGMHVCHDLFCPNCIEGFCYAGS